MHTYSTYMNIIKIYLFFALIIYTFGHMLDFILFLNYFFFF